MDQNTLSIQINSDKNLITRQVSTQRILEIRLLAPLVSIENHRPTLNLALVLDRSGSMAGEKLSYVKHAAIHVLDQLQEQDQVALVVYDNTIQVLAHSLNVSADNRVELKQRIQDIRSGSMTALAAGWLTGCREIAASAREETNNRTMLLTDGLANVGETDLEILANHAFELYKDSVSTSTFGVGHGFNEHLLEAMANRGGGSFYYIPNPGQIPDIFLNEFNDLVGITARKVEIKLALPLALEWQVLGGWPAEYKDEQLHIYVGDMLTGKTQDIYVKLQIPAHEKSDKLLLNARVFSQVEPGKVFETKVEFIFRVADQKDVEVAPLDRELMERFSTVELADTATEALKLERLGEREKANRILHENINRNRPYVSPQQASNYQGMSDRIKRGMDESDRKQSHYDVYRQKRKKDDKEEK